MARIAIFNGSAGRFNAAAVCRKRSPAEMPPRPKTAACWGAEAAEALPAGRELGGGGAEPFKPGGAAAPALLGVIAAASTLLVSYSAASSAVSAGTGAGAGAAFAGALAAALRETISSLIFAALPILPRI